MLHIFFKFQDTYIGSLKLWNVFAHTEKFPETLESF